MWRLPTAWLLGHSVVPNFYSLSKLYSKVFSFYLLRKISESYETKRSSMTCASDMAAIANCFEHIFKHSELILNVIRSYLVAQNTLPQHAHFALSEMS